MAGITLDTGALIGLERHERRMLARLALVMASAANRSDIVYTLDFDDQSWIECPAFRRIDVR